jgi:tetratricopeptide (TPR) repeat protein
MVLALDTLPRKTLAVVLTAAASLPLANELWRQYRADSYARQGSSESIERAIALEPTNAEFRNRLGRVLLFTPGGEIQRAKSELEYATQLDPRSASYAIDFALALELVGDFDGAARAISAARRAEPRTPAVLWQETNFWLRREQNGRALGLARELLRMAPEYTGRTVPLFLRVMTGTELLERLVPGDIAALAVVLEIFRREDRLDAAERLWQRSVELGQALPEGYVRAFVDWVLSRGQGELALRAWSEAARKRWSGVEPESLAQPFYNADFRYPLLNFGFDWRVLPHPEASVWVESRGPKAGEESLCVQFSEDARSEYAGVLHYVPVEPSYHYALNTSMRTEKLVSHTGAWLQVQEAAPGRAITPSTDPVMGSTPWKNVALQFETGPETRLVRLVLVRPAATTNEPPAGGLVCIAPVEWKALGPGRRVAPGGAGR